MCKISKFNDKKKIYKSMKYISSVKLAVFFNIIQNIGGNAQKQAFVIYY